MGPKPVFAELYESHYRRVFGLCRQLLGSAVRAEDATAEVFMRAYKAFDRYDSTQPFAGWILAIASRHCIDLVRRRKNEATLLGDEVEEKLAAEADDGDALDALETAERAREVNAAISALPERYRLPLVLAYYRDATYDEIASELGTTRTHVGVLICRAKQALRKALAANIEETTQ
jgi:RNA polymerase sigma-70 factor, ECF subfamily